MNLTKKNQILNNLYKMKMVGYEYIKSPLLNTATNNISLPNNLTQLLQMVSNCDLCYYSNNKYTNHNFQDNISDIKVIKSSRYFLLDDNTIETIKEAYSDYPRPSKPTLIKIFVNYKLY